jgi:hypothetical protein
VWEREREREREYKQEGLGIVAEHEGLKRGQTVGLVPYQLIIRPAVLEVGTRVADVVQRVEDHEHLLGFGV